VSESGNSSGRGPSAPSGGGARRRRRPGRSGSGSGQGQNRDSRGNNGAQGRSGAEGRGRDFQASSRGRRSGRPLTSNQILVKYDNLLEQHLITRKKYFEYFNRVDERQLRRLEKNFYTSIEHLRRFETQLEPWQRETLEKRKTERYRLDLTYSNNRNLDTTVAAPIEVSPEEIEDPHFKGSQQEAFEEYKDDTEESVGSFEDYLKLKGLA
jgi:hypothetical protein